MADDSHSSGGRLRPAPRWVFPIGAAAGLFCLAAAFLGWAGHALLQAEPAPAREVSSGSNVLSAEVAQRVVPRKVQDNSSAERQQRQRLRPERTAKVIEPPAELKATKPPVVEPPKAQPEPERIAIPALNIDQDLVELAVIGTRLQVPDDYDDVGWWRDGPAPGEPGAAVVVGHVDSLTGPAVFYGLSDLRRGDRIAMWENNGPRSTFEVRKTTFYDRGEFPSDRVYRSQGRPSLHLLTCGGSFDEATGQYTGNVVVYAELVKPRQRERHQGRNEEPHPRKHEQSHPGRRQEQHRERQGRDQEQPQERQLRQPVGRVEYDQRPTSDAQRDDRRKR